MQYENFAYEAQRPQCIQKLLGEDRNRQIRRSEDPGTVPRHVSGGGVSPEHIHHHRDKTLALVDSMICIGTCSENSRSPRIKFAWHMLYNLIRPQWYNPTCLSPGKDEKIVSFQQQSDRQS
ncbi:hypothetical protein XU18_4222 [Perkinsela sp. CCAP 1560/4]|nr:hypothetical protein XU18_4222 [Perkinsela sp. CCAP 1560/4]|eukprot:KNH04538.1 hypothetical protein XU18_4222 [Perkinsela sp. CCAP 1560/4]